MPSDLESVLNSAFLGTHIDLFEEKSFRLYFLKNIKQSILLNSMVLSRWGRCSTYMRRAARQEGGGREFSSKMPRTMSYLPDFPSSSSIPICTSMFLYLIYAHNLWILVKGGQNSIENRRPKISWYCTFNILFCLNYAFCETSYLLNFRNVTKPWGLNVNFK